MKQSKIRNFCIIAHIDHGKSTLADRLLELTGTVEKRQMKEQILDQMELERERGITIKLQPVRMQYRGFEFNLIDTPGHVDFTYEVSRSLAACEGALLVVDATQGIQAQTLANAALAREQGLVIIPVVNKIDLPNAEPENTALELAEVFDFDDDEILFASAKTGENVEEILKRVIDKVPAPTGDAAQPLQALIFDSIYDKHRGVIVYVRVKNGQLETGEPIRLMASKVDGQAVEVGQFSPALVKVDRLQSGQVGYIVTGLREVGKARVGDTVISKGSPAEKPLSGYEEARPMVYASVFPQSGDDFPALRDAMEKLKLNDAALDFETTNIPSIGFGFRVGFLGLLHMDIVQERLTREFGLELVLTTPSVSYKVLMTDGKEQSVYIPAELPDPSQIKNISEPWVSLDVVTPESYLGGIMQLVKNRRGEHRSTDYLGPGRLKIRFEVPLANVISDFYDKLKSVSSGYASMNYDFLDTREADLVKVDVLVAGEQVDALSQILHRDESESEGRRIVEKLKGLLPRQQFAIALQATIGGKIIARETLSALRKDVTAKLYGGDVTRKMKLLKKQKKGKKRMKKFGKVEIPQKAFLELLRK